MPPEQSSPETVAVAPTPGNPIVNQEEPESMPDLPSPPADPVPVESTRELPVYLADAA